MNNLLRLLIAASCVIVTSTSYADLNSMQKIYNNPNLAPKIQLCQVISELGYAELAAYRVNNESKFQPTELPEYKKIYLMIDYKNTYALITDYNTERIGVYYATGEYCSVPQKDFSTYFKPIISIIYRKIK